MVQASGLWNNMMSSKSKNAQPSSTTMITLILTAHNEPKKQLKQQPFKNWNANVRKTFADQLQ